MGWQLGVVVLLTLQYISSSAGVPAPNAFVLPQRFIDAVNVPFNADNVAAVDKSLQPLEEQQDTELAQLGRILTKVLVQPWPKGVSPLLYVENDPPTRVTEDFPEEEEEQIFENIEYDLQPTPIKRSRYYRKYPWKRQNSRYDAENRYLCTPSKDDVFRLLVALHEARQGNRGATVNFCNRKRPASAVFTNIRFLG